MVTAGTVIEKDAPEPEEESYEAPLPEAGGIAFMTVYLVGGGQINVTARAHSALQALMDLEVAVSYAKQNLSAATHPIGPTPAKKDENPAPAAPGAPVASAAPAATAIPVAPVAAATGSANKPINTMAITKLEVAPRADGRVDLKFYEAGHQYPDLTSTRSIPDGVKTLEPTGAWTAQHLTGAQSYAVNFVAVWQESDKLNRNGKPYKNLLGLKPAA